MNIEEMRVVISAETSKLQKGLKTAKDGIKDLAKDAKGGSEAFDAFGDAASKAITNVVKQVNKANQELNSGLKKFSENLANIQMFPNYNGEQPWEESIASMKESLDEYKTYLEDVPSAYEDFLEGMSDNNLKDIMMDWGNASTSVIRLEGALEELGKYANGDTIQLTSGLVDMADKAHGVSVEIERITRLLETMASYENGGSYEVSGGEEYKELTETLEQINKEFGSVEGAKQKVSELAIEYADLHTQIQNIEDILPKVKEEQKTAWDLPGLKQVKTAVDEAKQKIEEFKNEAINNFSQAFAQSGNAYAATFTATLKTMGSLLLSIGKTIGNTIVAAVKKIGPAVMTIASGFAQATVSVGKFILKANPLHKVVKSLGNSIKSLGIRLKRVLVYSTIIKFVNSLKSELKNYLSTNKELMNGLGKAKGAWLTAFQPIYDAVLPILTALINKLTELGYAVASVTSKLFGGTVKSNQAAAESLKNTADAAANAKKQLASFDELNILSEDSSTSADETTFGDFEEPKEYKSWGEWYSEFLDKVLALMPKFNNLMIKAADAINKFSSHFLEMFHYIDANGVSVDQKAYEIGAKIAGIFNNFFDNVNWNTLGASIGAAIDNLLNLIVGYLKTFDFSKIGKAIADSLNGAISEIDWENVGYTFISFFNMVFSTVKGFVENFDWKQAGDAIADGIKSIFENFNFEDFSASIRGLIEGIFTLALELLKQLGTTLWADIKEYFDEKTEECGGNVVLGILKGIGDALVDIFNWVKDNICMPIINAFKSVFGINSPSTVMAELGGYIVEGLFSGIKLSEGWNNIKSWFGEKMENIKTWCSDTWSNIKETASDKWENIKSTVGDKLSGIVDGVKSFGTTANDNFNKTMGNIGQVIGDALGIDTENFGSGFSDMLDSADTFGTKLTDYFSEIGQHISDALTNGVNGGIRALNSLVSAYKKAKAEDYASQISSYNAKVASLQAMKAKVIPNFVYKAFRAISLPSLSNYLPRFANGGVIDSPTIGLMGEYNGARTNPEIITPEDKMREVFNESNEELVMKVDRLTNVVIEILNKDNSITIGDDVISASAARGNMNYKKRTGRSQFAV